MSEAVAEHKSESHTHDESHGHHGDYLSHIKPYLMVGAALFVFTLITVGLSYIDFAHIGITRWLFSFIGVSGMGINIVIGLIVATFKVCLVGAWFMHLKDEKAGIWRPLIFTFIFCLGLFLLCMLAYFDPIPSSVHWHH
jgi:caa(3)-type oxidase subunit IV